MPAPDRICLECGHEYAWHVRERASRKLGADPGMERSCYRQISGHPCPCAEFREGRQRLIAAPSSDRIFKNGVLTLLLLVMGLALLYAYRSQTPAIRTVPITQAIQEVQAGKVKVVTVAVNRATLEMTDGTKEQTQLPDNAKDDPLQQAILTYNAANPTRPVVLRYEEQNATFPVIGSVLLGLLPVLLIGGFFFYMMRTMRSRDD